jgi:hypothetical protein
MPADLEFIARRRNAAINSPRSAVTVGGEAGE